MCVLLADVEVTVVGYDLLELEKVFVVYRSVWPVLTVIAYEGDLAFDGRQVLLTDRFERSEETRRFRETRHGVYQRASD